jgi:2-oxoglutarate ferredoxin oxidoreductase subunit beta
METDKYPLGIFYINHDKKTFEENLAVYTEDKSPVYQRKVDLNKLETLINSKRSI